MKKFFLISFFFRVIFCQSVLAQAGTNSGLPQHPNFFWGRGTNGISAGICVETISKNVNDLIPVRINIMLYNSCTNNGNIGPFMTMLFAPPIVDRYKLELWDENGNAVERTHIGKLLGKGLPQPYIIKPNLLTGVRVDSGWRPGKTILLGQELCVLPDGLLLSDYFKIRTPGQYHLHCNVFMFKPHDDNINNQDLLSFPPIDAKIEITIFTNKN